MAEAPLGAWTEGYGRAGGVVTGVVGGCASARQELTQGRDWTGTTLSPARFRPWVVSPVAHGPVALSLPSATLLPCPGYPAPVPPRAPGGIR